MFFTGAADGIMPGIHQDAGIGEGVFVGNVPLPESLITRDRHLIGK